MGVDRVLFPASMGSYAMFTRITAGFSGSRSKSEGGKYPNVLQVIFNADPRGAYSKQCNIIMWAAQPFQKSGWYLVAQLCRAPWLQRLWLFLRCSHSYAD